MGAASLTSTTTLLYIFIIFITDGGRQECWGVELVVPANHTALSGELEVVVRWGGGGGRLELLERAPPGHYVLLGSMPVPTPRRNATQVKIRFPCGVVAKGGRYGIRFVQPAPRHTVTQENSTPSIEQEVVEDDETSFEEDDDDGGGIVELDVRWPAASVSLLPSQVQTYPEEVVTASLAFRTTFCQPAIGSVEPETWLDLLYCGHSPVGCTRPNATHKQLLYSEQIRGYPQLRNINLRCDLFGLAGHYALALRPSMQDPGEPIAATLDQHSLKAVWSEKFVFNVHARSIFPCEVHSGVAVLFQYPRCILPQGDRVRLFARLRADVSSVAPPTSLTYVSEQWVHRGRHSLRFDCSLFSEKYVEYCFVYVSQAITGAVSDVRMDCVPTLPVLESESGGWSDWSQWTQCTSTCSGGTRNRYRSCDSPPPRYGAKFCQGHALETESCGVVGGWDCQYYQDVGGGEVPADREEVRAEVGPGCRCGCIVHLSKAKPHRIVAASAHSCPGRSFWLIQTERGERVKVGLEQLRLGCLGQGLRLRDGDSTQAPLLAHLTGAPPEVSPVLSSGPSLLVEFTAGDVLAAAQECNGGFLAHATQIDARLLNSTTPAVETVVLAPTVWPVSGAVNAGVALTLLLAVLASACLGIQYLYRYRKYQLAAATEDMDSIAGNSCGSQGSLGPLKSRATSSTTLLSEVISLKRFHRGHKHSRLREEEDTGAGEPDNQLQNHSEDSDSQREEEGCEDEEKGDEKKAENVTKPGKGNGNKPVTVEVERRPNSLEVNRTPTLPRRQRSEGRLLKARKFMSPVSPVAEGPEEDIGSGDDSQSPLVKKSGVHNPITSSRPQGNGSSSSGSSIQTNSSGSNTAGGLKASKEKRNREKALAGSEFSLDLELDYYDYNVQNAEPGSYLSMDPAYCLWIPPFAPGPWEQETEFSEVGESTMVGVTEDKLMMVAATGVVVEVSPVGEKETHVEKSPTSSGDYHDILDNNAIKFADDDEDGEQIDDVEEAIEMNVLLQEQNSKTKKDNREAEEIRLRSSRVVYKK